MSTLTLNNKVNYNRNIPRERYLSSSQTNSDWTFKSSYKNNDWNVIDIISNPTIKISSSINSPKLFYKKQNLTIETSQGIFNLDERLHNIYESIQQSKSLLDCKDGWDEEDAVGCNSLIYDRAINLLIKYSQNVLRYHNVNIQAPEINLGRDGSIDLEWRCDKSIFLITTLNTLDFEAHFYGDGDGTVLKGSINDYTINRFLSYWMKCLM
ncbi:MAG: hypothetical protein ABI892_09035 [Flavobacterium sp.]